MFNIFKKKNDFFLILVSTQYGVKSINDLVFHREKQKTQ